MAPGPDFGFGLDSSDVMYWHILYTRKRPCNAENAFVAKFKWERIRSAYKGGEWNYCLPQMASINPFVRELVFDFCCHNELTFQYYAPDESESEFSWRQHSSWNIKYFLEMLSNLFFFSIFSNLLEYVYCLTKIFNWENHC